MKQTVQDMYAVAAACKIILKQRCYLDISKIGLYPGQVQ